MRLLATTFLVILAAQTRAAEPTQKGLREKVLEAETPGTKAKAYQAYFEMVGNKGLHGLLKDDDTSIALQAAWEVHKKAIKRPKRILARSNDVYDPKQLGKFLALVRERTKAPVPEWWAKCIVDIDLFPGQHHAVVGGVGPKFRESDAGPEVPEGAELKLDGNSLRFSTGGKSIRFDAKTFDDDDFVFGGRFAGFVGEKRSAVADYFPIGGTPFRLAGFEGKGGKARWKATVWAACRQTGGISPHSVELTSKDNSLFVFGAESHGIYLEGFDLANGKCLFRFCSCYWFTFSERWVLKD